MVEQEQENDAKALEKALELIETVTRETMGALFKHQAPAVPMAALGCMQALFTFTGVKGNSDSILAISEELNFVSKHLELLSRVYAFIEESENTFDKVKTLEAFNDFLASKTENDKILYVENVNNGEIKFTALASLPAAPQQKNPYGYFAL